MDPGFKFHVCFTSQNASCVMERVQILIAIPGPNL